MQRVGRFHAHYHLDTDDIGMFLFVKLVWDNLLAQNTLQALEEELDPAVMPHELYAA